MDFKKGLMINIIVIVIALNLLNFFIIYSVDTNDKITGNAVGQVRIDIGPFYDYQCGEITTDHGRWNYVSTPVIPRWQSITKSMYSIENKFDWLYEYSVIGGNSNWDWYWTSFPQMGPLQDMYATNCYVVRATQNGTLNFTGIASQNNIIKNLTTDAGAWNFVGWINQTTTLSAGLSSVNGKYEWVYEYDPWHPDLWKFYWASFPFISTLNDLRPCKCYIIKATVNSTLSYSK